MGVPPENRLSNSYDRFREEAKRFFEVQLERLDLSEAQIATQEIPQLEDSLVRVDDALRHPESFGVLRVSVSSDTTLYIVKANTESHVEVGVVPLLLERKKRIIDRLRSLRSQRPICTIADLIDTLADAGLRELLRTELDATRQSVHTIAMATDVRTDYAFIAMAMDPQDPQLEDVLDAIKDGAAKCSIIAERIDEAISNEPITARMLGSIEKAEFVIVDLSNARHNVYYEAGYAQGLGKTPIYLARKGTEIPFDVRDYPVILYPNLRELKSMLVERLKAIRRGRK